MYEENNGGYIVWLRMSDEIPVNIGLRQGMCHSYWLLFIFLGRQCTHLIVSHVASRTKRCVQGTLQQCKEVLQINECLRKTDTQAMGLLNGERRFEYRFNKI